MSAKTQVRGESLNTRTLIKYLDGTFNPDGSYTCEAIFAVSADSLLTSLPVVIAPDGTPGEEHPLFPDFQAKTFRWNHHPRVSAQVVFLTITYEALPTETAIEEDEADSIAGEETIESHPAFLNSPGGGFGIAGEFPNGRTVTPAGGISPGNPNSGINPSPNPQAGVVGPGYFEGFPRDGAIFDTFGQNLVATASDYNTNVGKFLFFAPGFALNGVIATGLERYFLPRGTYSRSFSTGIKPSLAGVGKLNGNPPNAPLLGQGYTWLLTRRSYRTTGFVYRVTEQYMAGQWNPAIYGLTSVGLGGAATGGPGNNGSATSGTAGGVQGVVSTPNTFDAITVAINAPVNLSTSGFPTDNF